MAAVAQRLERATDIRVLAGSNPTEAVWNFLYPTLQVSFGRETKCRCSLLAMCSKISLKRGKYVTCVMEFIILPDK